MNIDEDNSQFILTNTLRFHSSMNVPQNIACLSVHYLNTLDSLIFSLDGSRLFIVKLDMNNLDKDIYGVNIENLEDKSANNSLKTIYQKNGENLVCFKELGSNSLNGTF